MYDSSQFHWMCNFFLVDSCAFVYKYEVLYTNVKKESVALFLSELGP